MEVATSPIFYSTAEMGSGVLKSKRDAVTGVWMAGLAIMITVTIRSGSRIDLIG